MHELATEEYMLRMENPAVIVKYYTTSNGEITYEQIVPTSDKSLPICYVLGLADKHVILYSPTMTFIDGFDPHTGEGRFAVTPNILLKKARTSLFASSKRKPVKKVLMRDVTEVSPVSSRNSSCHGGMSRGLAVFSPVDFTRQGFEFDLSVKQDPSSDYEPETLPPTLTRHPRYDKSRGCCSESCSIF